MPEDRKLRTTFDSAAASYHAARPDYPLELYSDLIDLSNIRPPARLLDVGCGTGKATVPLARRGFRITALELGEQLAAEARRNLMEFPGVEVITSSFEEWEPDAADPFDLVYSATAWHWMTPEVKWAKAAALLAPGGHLAVWGAAHGFPADADPFFTEIQEVYDEIGASHGGEWPPPPPEQMPDASAEFESSGYFEFVGSRRYVWALRYTADEYIALLETFSGHIAMDPARSAYLYDEIRRRLAERADGRVTRHWVAVLTVGRRR